MAPTWPLECLSTTSFSEREGKTSVEVRSSVMNGTNEEHEIFNASHASMQQGWGGTFDRLTAYLAGK
jgi:uncharacterized protein YndB with AHSA1/START domain